jgi:NAD-dependent dihydropyrimidine dehydrogenase PreA subunit
METKKFVTKVDTERCKACGYCRDACPRGVFAGSGSFNHSGYLAMEAVHTEACVGCMQCVMTCPDFAIRVEPA